MRDFREKVVLVTGGASGLGAGLAAALLERGASVVIADINVEGAQALASRWVAERGDRAWAVALDVTSSEQVDGVVDEVVRRHGRIDLLINNAGIAVGGEFHDVPPRAVRRVLDINLLGAAQVMQAVYRVMVKQGGGHIVNIASMYGLIPGAMAAAYAAAKHGVVGLTESVRAEARQLGVTFTLVCPGFIATNLFAAGEYSPGLDAERVVSRIPFRIVSVDDAVAAILNGVTRGKSIVVFPWYARLFWWLHRLHPGLLVRLSAAELARQRARGPAESR